MFKCLDTDFFCVTTGRRSDAEDARPQEHRQAGARPVAGAEAQASHPRQGEEVRKGQEARQRELRGQEGQGTEGRGEETSRKRRQER